MTRCAGAFAVLVLWGCAPDRFLPPGAPVPTLADDPALATRVAEADGLSDRVLRIHGFSEGEPIWYWDLGPVEGDRAMPVHVLCRPEGRTCVPIDHPRIAEALPGSASYASFGWIHEVPVTDRYAGQVIPSVLALEDARRAGLLGAPEPTRWFVELAIAHPDVQLELAEGSFVGPNATVYAEGVAAPAFDFEAAHGRLPLVDPSTGQMLVRNVYVLTRQGEALPIHERARGTDLTGDGDTADSNNILGTRPGEPDFSSLWQVVRVTVPADYASIDTAGDDSVASARAATDLFTIAPDYSLTPIAGRVVAFTVEPSWVNCPVQSAPGEL